MPRVLFVTTVPGTIRIFLLPFVDHFRSQGWMVDGMADGIDACPRCKESFDRTWQIDWSRNPLDPRNCLRAPAQLRAAVKERGYDLVHVHTPVAAFVTRYALHSLPADRRPKVVYTAHGFHFHPGGGLLKNSLYLAMEKLAGRWTDHLVVINSEDLASAKRFRLVPPGRVHFMPGIGVDTSIYGPTTADPGEGSPLHRELELPPTAKIVLMIAEFIPRKRHADALQALARLGREDVHLVCAGRGPLLERMQQLAATLSIDRQVHFLGFRGDLPDCLRSAAIVLLPSAQEGLPRSLMEAMCHGIPCIGSDIRGTRDLLAGDCGLLFRVGDVEALAAALTWLLDHPEAAERMGREGYRRIQGHDLKLIVKMHEDLYGSVLGT